MTKKVNYVTFALLFVTIVLGSAVAYMYPMISRPSTTVTVTQSKVSVPVGGTLTIGVAAEPDKLDGLDMNIRTTEGVLMYALYDQLLMQDEKFNLVPELAVSYDQPDKLTYIFHLRQNVKFHDGTPFNATAVKAVFDRAKGTRRESAFSDIQSTQIVDPYTFRVNLKTAAPTFLYKISTYVPITSPTAYQSLGPERFNRRPVGTGPFKFVEWVSGSRITLEANKDYWGGRPNLDKVILRIISDPTVQVMELQTGGIQLLEVDPKFVTKLQALGTLKLMPGSSDRQSVVTWRNDRKPFSDVQVRRAINYAIDKQAIADAVYNGLAWPGVGLIRHGVQPYYEADLAKYSYDPQKAKALLTEAGYPNGFKTSIMYESGRDVDPEMATILQQQLKKVGIELELKPTERGTYDNKKYSADFEMVLTGWRGSDETPSGYLRQWYHSSELPTSAGGTKTISWNFHVVNNSRINTLLDQLDSTTDANKWKEIVHEIQVISIDQAYDLHLLDRSRWHATASNVMGYKVHPHFAFGHIISKPSIGINVYMESGVQQAQAPMLWAATSVRTSFSTAKSPLSIDSCHQ